MAEKNAQSAEVLGEKTGTVVLCQHHVKYKDTTYPPGTLLRVAENTAKDLIAHKAARKPPKKS